MFSPFCAIKKQILCINKLQDERVFHVTLVPFRLSICVCIACVYVLSMCVRVYIYIDNIKNKGHSDEAIALYLIP